MLGAESFGFGTGPMVALGCKYLRICHLDHCATGIATQNETLRRDHFIGLPEMVMNYFRFVAEDVREHLGQLGVRSPGELVGRCDLLSHLEGTTPVHKQLDLSRLISFGGVGADVDSTCTLPRNPMRDEAALAMRIAHGAEPLVVLGSGATFLYTIASTDRAIGARLSGDVARRWGDHGVPEPIILQLEGGAGQSLGAWNTGGVQIELTGEANDGVGKGMTGAPILVRPAPESAFASQKASILGNTCLYGVTGGELFAAGRAGERFGVRNSGAMAVIEGAGDDCCEYMTGGVVAVLGACGLNFGAGMTGGFAYVLDLERNFVDCYNHELVDIVRISGEGMEHHMQHLRSLIARHAELTGSAWATHLQSVSAGCCSASGWSSRRQQASLRWPTNCGGQLERQVVSLSRSTATAAPRRCRWRSACWAMARSAVTFRCRQPAARPSAAWTAATRMASTRARCTTAFRTG